MRTYIYYPLGGSRRGKIRTYVNILIVFCVSGIWHGANWTFILWGIIHGIANVLNRIFSKTWEKCNKVFQWICTFVFINITWLIFRAESIGQAIDLLKRAFSFQSSTISYELIKCFHMVEADIMMSLLGVSRDYNNKTMFLWFAGALFLCLNLTNLNENKMKFTLGRAVLTSVLLVWSIISLSGVSTFLYFNF